VPGKKFTVEQIVAKLREAEKLVDRVIQEPDHHISASAYAIPRTPEPFRRSPDLTYCRVTVTDDSPTSDSSGLRPQWSPLDKTCPGCQYVNRNMSSPVCRACGFDFRRPDDDAVAWRSRTPRIVVPEEAVARPAVTSPLAGDVSLGRPPLSSAPDLETSPPDARPANRRTWPRIIIALCLIVGIADVVLAVQVARTRGPSSAGGPTGAQSAGGPPCCTNSLSDGAGHRASRSAPLALLFRSGQTSAYRMSMKVNATIAASGRSQSLDSISSENVHWDVLSVNPNGTATIEVTASNATVTTNGRTQPIDVAPQTLLLTRDGRLLSANAGTLFADAPGGRLLGGGGELSAILPGTATKPGQSWTRHVSFTMLGSSLKYTLRSTYLRDERLGAEHAAVVRTDGTVPVDVSVRLSQFATLLGFGGRVPPAALLHEQGNMRVHTVSWIDLGARRLLKTNGTSRMALQLTVSGVKGATRIGPIALNGILAMSLQRR
jgi:hypothetical protein